MNDEIVAEVRKAREELASRVDFDLKRMLAEARKRQNKSGHEVVSFVPKPKRA